VTRFLLRPDVMSCFFAQYFCCVLRSLNGLFFFSPVRNVSCVLIALTFQNLAFYCSFP